MNTQQFGKLIPIPKNIEQQCRSFTRYVQPERAEEVRQRAIAVWVVSRYLHRFGYGCELDKSSAWNPALQLLTDLADLEVFDNVFEDDRLLGVVECMPIAPDADRVEIPEQAATSDRIAYIAVEVNPEQTWGAIVGFTPALKVKSTKLSIKRNRLLSDDRLLDLLEMAEPLTDESLLSDSFSELQEYWKTHGNWSEEQRSAIVAQLERALILQSKEPRQIDSAARELEKLIAQSIGEERKPELATKEEGGSGEERQKLRSILGRLFQSLRKELE